MAAGGVSHPREVRKHQVNVIKQVSDKSLRQIRWLLRLVGGISLGGLRRPGSLTSRFFD